MPLTIIEPFGWPISRHSSVHSSFRACVLSVLFCVLFPSPPVRLTTDRSIEFKIKHTHTHTKQETPPLKDIAAAIKVSGISKIDLSMDEVKLIVTTLVYDGLLEEVRGAASRFNRNVSETGGEIYCTERRGGAREK